MPPQTLPSFMPTKKQGQEILVASRFIPDYKVRTEQMLYFFRLSLEQQSGLKVDQMQMDVSLLLLALCDFFNVVNTARVVGCVLDGLSDGDDLAR